MKKVMRKVKQSLSILLAVAMVVTCVPQTGFSVLAAPETEEGTTDEADIIVEDTADDAAAGDETATDVVDDATADDVEAGDDVLPEEGEDTASEEDGSDVLDENTNIPGTDEDSDVLDEETDIPDTEEDNEPLVGAGEEHTVTIPTGDGYEIDANEKATNGIDYTFKVTAKDGYAITAVKVAIGGAEAQTLTGTEGTYTITGSEITGAIVISVEVEAPARQYTVTVDNQATEALNENGITYKIGEGGSETSYTEPVKTEENSKFTLKVEAKAGYEVSVKNGNDTITAGTDGTYVIASVTEDITLTITAEQVGFAIEENYPTGVTATYTSGVDDANKLTKKGEDIKFSLSGIDNVRVDKVTYKIADGNEVELKDEGGSYTIPADVVKGKVIIIVEVSKKVTVTFAENNFADISEVKVGGTAIADITNGVTAYTGDEITFKAAGKTMFKVASVKVGDVTLKADTKDTYTYTAGDADAAITVETELDEETCNKFTFKLAGNKNSYTGTVSGFDATNGDVVTDSSNIEIGKAVLTVSGKVTATIKAADGFIIDKIEGVDESAVSGTAIDDSAENKQYREVTVTLTFTEEKKAFDVTVTTVSEGTKTAKEVAFNKVKEELAYAVTGDDKVTAKTDTPDSYDVAEGARFLEFTVTSPLGLVPEVTHAAKKTDNPNTPEGQALTTIEPEEEELVSGKMVYRYSVAASLLEDNAEITINAAVKKQTVTVKFNADEVEVALTAASNPTAATVEGGAEYTVEYGEEAKVTVTAKDNCKITGVEGVKVTVAADGSKAEFEVDTTADAEFTVKSVSEYAFVLKDKAGNPLTADNKGVYAVDYEGTYTVEVTKGSKNTPANLTSHSAPAGVTVARSNNQAVITFDAKTVGGKTVKVELLEDENVAATLTLKVASVAAKATVAGVKSGTLTQAIDTTGEYAITLTPKDADISKVKVVKEDAENIIKSAAIEEGKLVLATNQVADKSAKIKLVLGEGENAVVLTEITVKTEQLIKGKITAKAKSSTDIALTLSLTAPKGMKVPDTGKLWYEITVDRTGEDAIFAEKTVVYVAKEGDAQDATVQVTADKGAALGVGKANDFSAKVRLIHVSDSADTIEGTVAQEKVLGESAVANIAKLSTKNPYYEDKLKLKKVNTTVYTTQENVEVAIPQFGKNTTFTSVTAAKDISYNYDENANYNSGLKAWIDADTGNVMVSATAQTVVGKHTIEVTAITDDTKSMVASKATIVVTVVRGIENLSVTVPSDRIFKDGKKAASLKAIVTYNNGYSGTMAPKAKKVQWDLVKEATAEAAAITADSGLSIKNGTISVNKNYEVSDTRSDNQFYVRVKAIDFAGNKTVAYSRQITIEKSAMELGAAFILTANNEVIKTGAKNIEASMLDPVYDKQNGSWKYPRLLVAKSGKEPSADDIESNTFASDATNFTYTSSNKKAVTIDSNGYIRLLQPAKNVKLTATANDGSKKKAEMTVTLGYNEADELGIYLYQKDRTYKTDTLTPVATSEHGQASTTYDIKDAATAVFQINVHKWVPNNVEAESAGGNWQYVAYPDCKISVSGGKVIYKNDATGQVDFVANTDKVTITLENKANKAKKTMILTNSGVTEVKKKKAPKVTLSHNIYANSWYSKGYEPNIAGKFVDKDVDFTDKYARVEIDWTAMTAKNKWSLEDFASQLVQKDYFKVNSDGSFTLNFEAIEDGSGQKYCKFLEKSYKLKATLGTIDADGNFKPYSQSASVTLKLLTSKNTKPSYKPATAYKISTRDGSFVQLTGKGNVGNNVTYSNLRNANVKGEANEFTKYFKLESRQLENNTTIYGLALTDFWKSDEFRAPSKDDLTAHVDYSVLGGYISGTVQIKVTLSDKAVVKYAVSKASVTNGSHPMVTSVSVTANKQPVNVVYACSAADDMFKVKRTDGADAGTAINSSVIELQEADSALVKKYNITLYVLTDDYYASAIGKITDAAEKEQFIREHGVELKTAVTVCDAAKQTKKITFAKNALKQTFTSASFDSTTQAYKASAGYTYAVTSSIKSISSDKDYVQFTNVDGSAINISLDKAKLATAVEAGGVSYSTAKKASKVKVKATVEFNNAKAEEYTFELTLPVAAENVNADAAKAKFTDAAVAEIAASIKVTGTDEESQKEAKTKLYEAICEFVGKDSGLALDNEEALEMKVTAKEATSTKAGSLSIEVTLKDATSSEDTGLKKTFVIVISATGTTPSDVEAGVTAFTTDYKATNKTTAADVQAALRSSMADWAEENQVDISNLRFFFTQLARTEATSDNSGAIAGKLTVRDIRNNAEPLEKENVSILIPQLREVTAIVAAINEAVTVAAVKEILDSKGADALKEEILKLAQTAVGGDPYVVAYAVVKEGEDENATEKEQFAYDPSTLEKGGSIIFTLALKNEAGKVVEGTGFTEVTVTLDKLPKPLADIASEVKEAVEKMEVSNTTDLAAVKIAAGKVITDGKYDGVTVVEVTEGGFNKTDATEEAKGSITGKLQLKRGEDTEVVEFSMEIAQLPKTEKTVQQIAEEAVADIEITSDDTADSSTTKEGKENAIVTAVQTALDGYTVTKKNGLAAVESDATKATITLTVSKDGTDTEVVLTFTLKTTTTGGEEETP